MKTTIRTALSALAALQIWLSWRVLGRSVT